MAKKFNLVAAIAALFVVFLIGCASTPAGDAIVAGSADDPFAGTSWEGGAYTLSFDKSGKANGSAVGFETKYDVTKTESGYAMTAKRLSVTYKFEIESESATTGTLSFKNMGITTKTTLKKM